MFTNYDFSNNNHSRFELNKAVEPPIMRFVGSSSSDESSMLHSILGKCVLPAAGYYQDNKSKIRNSFVEWVKYLNDVLDIKLIRLSVDVNGKMIDVLIMGREERLRNGNRWILQSCANLDYFEKTIENGAIHGRVDALEANYLFFNYPGVGASEGEIDQNQTVETYHGMMCLLEEVIEAKEIIMFGSSIGGGVQGMELSDHQFKEGVKYLSVMSQTFSSLSKVTAEFDGTGLAKLPWYVQPLVSVSAVKFVGEILESVGWTLESMSSARRLERLGIRQIVIQTATHISDNLTDPGHVVDDDVVTSMATLARGILDQQEVEWKTKRILGVIARHGVGYNPEEELMIRTVILAELEKSVPFMRFVA